MDWRENSTRGLLRESSHFCQFWETSLRLELFWEMKGGSAASVQMLNLGLIQKVPIDSSLNSV